MVRLDGDLAFDTADGLVTTVGRLLAGWGAAEVVLDLAGVDFLDSSGVRALLQVRRAVVAQGGVLSVSGARGLAAEVLRITAVEEWLNVTGRPGS